ncbi:uncharacterized protein BJ212DRAFT_1294641 [Suillus subaureus]|uniref:Uncharacterized protein n=1 Tax=Suillus subaureus TaxID=48587 RepID=A0A9P7EQ77_9AGAM|nr:uncharacterized protein BJ212DRAFT_1294641 [Suillus subaureus]KAG1827341.1 hypothetical protein BJ212DRAFT_1294641 [Suillus subaureus]
MVRDIGWDTVFSAYYHPIQRKYTTQQPVGSEALVQQGPPVRKADPMAQRCLTMAGRKILLHRSNDLSPLPPPWKLTVAHAKELFQLWQVQSIHTHQDLDNDMDLTDSNQDLNNNKAPISHDADNSDVFADGETYCGDNDNYEDLHHLKCLQASPSDDEGDSTHSQKWMRKSEDSPSLQQVDQ